MKYLKDYYIEDIKKIESDKIKIDVKNRKEKSFDMSIYLTLKKIIEGLIQPCTCNHCRYFTPDNDCLCSENTFKVEINKINDPVSFGCTYFKNKD